MSAASIMGLLVSAVLLALLALLARMLVRSPLSSGWRGAGWIVWLSVVSAFVAFMGFAGINRLDCSMGGPSGWRALEWGTDDICDQRSLFEVIF